MLGLEKENLQEGRQSASNAGSGERTRRPKMEIENNKKGKVVSRDPNPPSDDELKQIANEVANKLGPLSDDEFQKIREWLKLGS